jgi:riboflavin synthase
LKYGQNISGHICQGHVDTVGIVNKITKSDKSIIFDISIDNKFKKDLIEKASILINGVSLTISKITKKGFKLWIIPHTLKLTNLNNLKKKDKVNKAINFFYTNYLQQNFLMIHLHIQVKIIELIS